MRIDKKIKFARLAHLLFFRRHKYPGVRDWELEKYIGRDYEAVIDEFNKFLSQLDLEVRCVEVPDESAGKIRYYVVRPKYRDTIHNIKTYGWRIDEMAILISCIGMILAGNGKALRKDVEEILIEKFPEWRIKSVIDKFIRLGYLRERDNMLEIGLRSYLEIDFQKLTALLIGSKAENASSSESSSSQTQ